MLDSSQLRRAERLWAVATNESATVAERRRAMDKLDDIITETKEHLAHADTKQHTTWLDKTTKRQKPQENNTAQDTHVLLDAINAVLAQGHDNNIIAPPHRVAQLSVKEAPLMLTQ